ncbi:MAG: MFS transporter [Crenarchaeota archaeon]|nr:MFS transporter [Thermoproteota archaeon]
MLGRWGKIITMFIASALFICYLVSSALVLVIPLYLKVLDFSTVMIGLVVSVSSFVRIPLAFFAGYLSDIVGKFRMLVIGCLLTSIGIFMLEFPYLITIVIGRLIFGLFGAFITPILWSYVSHIASRYGRTGRMIGLIGMVTNAASVISYLLFGILIDLLGFYNIILTLSILIILIIFSTIPVRTIEYENKKILKPSFRDVIRFVRNNFIILILCLCCLLEWYVVYSWLMLVVLYMKSLGFSGTTIGTALTIETLVYMIAQPVIGRVFDRLKERSLLMLTSAIGYAAILIILPHVRTFIHIITLLICLALVSSPISVTLFSMISLLSPQEKRGSIMGLMFMFGYMGIAIGTLLSGFIASFSYILSFSYLSIPLTLIAMLGIIGYLKLRRFFIEE